MPKQPKRWVRVKVLTKEEKDEIAAVCGRFIADVLKPRFLPEIRPTQFNYPVDMFGKWRGNQYSFITRYRSGFPETLGEEFNAPFARLDHVEEHLAERRFDLMWHRHTGQWRCLHDSVTLEEALRLIESDGLLHPV
jgi:hypothetical protein